MPALAFAEVQPALQACGSGSRVSAATSSTIRQSRPEFCAGGDDSEDRCNSTQPCHTATELVAVNASQACGALGLLDIFDVSEAFTRALTVLHATLPAAERVSHCWRHDSTGEGELPGTKHAIAAARGGYELEEALHGLRYDCFVTCQQRQRSVQRHFRTRSCLPRALTEFRHAVGTHQRRPEPGTTCGCLASKQLSGTPNNACHFRTRQNLCRDPRWGRCPEVPSECPLLSGEYAMQYVKDARKRQQRPIL